MKVTKRADPSDSSPLDLRTTLLALLVCAACGASAFAAKLPSGTTVQTARATCAETTEEEILDLEQLETGLRKSRAVGMVTKLKLKGEIDKLLARLKTYHLGVSSYTLEQLHEQFDLLYMKVVALVQDKDADLHTQLCVSWDIIWTRLRDPDAFK
ncbi:MAG: hypothetical protein OEV34_11910 [Gammaproteobacteria bacterium]|jgi:hypothetical protein|nr:hypothetical protein [Gammaproteobacteria bacterium]